jgi:hypothetical protein
MPSRPAVPSRKYGPGSDALWGAVAVLGCVMLVGAVVTPLWRLLVTEASWALLVLTPLNVLLSVFVLAGAWRRTSWGAPHDTVPPGTALG